MHPLPAAPLPPCRHRGAALGPGLWRCCSPKVVAPRGVTPEMCASRCAYVDHADDPRFPALPGAAAWFLGAAGPGPVEPVPRSVRPRPELLALAMITAPRERPTLARSLRELRRAGFPQDVQLFAEPGAD